ncbi:MAG TPA: hypothetical protein VJB89_01150 [Candidatus Nanoarchaeia archaeon]|nr:hypothetical protein [Candidatus Nanoarchaeia archaeon]
MKPEEILKILIGAIIIIAIVGAFFGMSQIKTDKIINWIIPVGISFFISAFIGQIIEYMGLGFLKRISINVPIGWFKFPISIFLILILIIKYWILKI